MAPEADGDPDRLAAREALEARPRRRRVDEQDAQGREGEGAAQHDEIEPARPGDDAADHRGSPRRSAAGAHSGRRARIRIGRTATARRRGRHDAVLRLEERLRERRRGEVAVAAVLDEHDDDHRRIAHRAEAREPRVVLQPGPVGPGADRGLAARRPGPCRSCRRSPRPATREPNAVPPGSFTTAHMPSLTSRELLGRDREALPELRLVAELLPRPRILRGVEEVRRRQPPALEQTGERPRHLQRRHEQRALADRDRDRLARDTSGSRA